MRKRTFQVAIDDEVWDFLLQFFREHVAQLLQAPLFTLALCRARLVRCGKSRRERDALCSRPKPALLRATLHYSREIAPIRKIERADPVRAVKLVASEAHEIDAKGVRSRRQIERRLARVGMKKYARSMALLVLGNDTCNLAERLHRPYLIVRPAHGNKNRLWSEHRAQILRRDDTARTGQDMGNAPTQTLYLGETIEDGGVLYRAYKPVRASESSSSALERVSETENGDVVGLGESGGKDELARFHFQELGNALTRPPELLHGFDSLAMQCAGIADEVLRTQHCGKRLLAHWRRGRIVEIYSFILCKRPHTEHSTCSQVTFHFAFSAYTPQVTAIWCCTLAMTAKNEKLVERPPIVVVMGHVDHGKSTLLDFIRKSNTVAKEAGGITQHVAAYEVSRETIDPSTSLRVNKRITFIDTPGHAAFSAIRARGANAADIAILVVAADDGVKAQTLEALAQIREAGIPFIVAINKIDKPNANVDRTQASLLEQHVYLEKFGGDVPWAAVSAKNGTGVQELLDLILIVAEMHEYKADAAKPAEGWVVEAHRDQKRGIAATLIITEGELKSGMAVTAGGALAPVRIMEDHMGRALKSASFSSPVSLIGFDELPAIGTRFCAYRSKRDAEEARSSYLRSESSTIVAAAVDDAGEKFYLPVIVRADATGTLEAVLQEAARIGDEYSRLSIVQSGIGNVSEGDIKSALSGSLHGVVVGFNVGTDAVAEALARQHGVRIEHFDIIYKLTERLEELLTQLRPKRTVEQVVGRARILKIFSSRKGEHLVGGNVTEGFLEKRASIRVLRRSVDVGIGWVTSIETNKQAADRAEAGNQFGAQIETTFELAPGDLLECFHTSEE